MLPGVYRQTESVYSFAIPPVEVKSHEYVLHDLEPDDEDVYAKSHFAYDIMRTEQHYAAGTRGLDLTFDIDSALFFATHRFAPQPSGTATYQPVRHGEHSGVIYCFRFREPPVKQTEYHIRDFDLFRTYRPERIVRQQCGLPLIGDHERNTAICDIDCVIRLHSEFSVENSRRKEFMFPNVTEDRFYSKLLELKQRFPDELGHVVEYEWARS